MPAEPIGPVTLHAQIEQWPLTEPFRITGYTWEVVDVLLVSLEKDGCVGRGEAAGVYYRNDKPATMLRQLESTRAAIEKGVSRETLQSLLPPGGARNALDCAFWELEARLQRAPVWKIAGLSEPRRVLTTCTCGADSPERMVARARGYSNARAIKLKLTGDAVDAERVRAVRAALPDVWLGVDANQGFTRASLERLMPVLVDANVKLIEQPFAVGEEALLDGFHSAIPIAADESVQSAVDIAQLVGRFDFINIKLDKCGGLTEGLAMVQAARKAGIELMVGNMIGTSLAMAPALVVGQFCSVADLDGPLFLQLDRSPSVRYEDGYIACPPGVWG
jgi:L-Ala-D/L-Glu epimerase / N-acetyl-D-glutamate racemase